MEEIPGLQMPGIDQSIDLDKDCDQFALGKIRVIFTNFHEVQLSLRLSSQMNLTCLQQQMNSCF